MNNKIIASSMASYTVEAGIFDNIQKLKDVGQAAKDKLKQGMKHQIDHVSKNLKITKEAVALAYEEPRMSNIMQAVGYSTATLYGAFVQANHAAHDGVFTVLSHIVSHEALHKIGHKVGHKEHIGKIDKVLDKYPLVKKLSGPAVAGLLLYGYCLAPLNKLSDWDLSNVSKALKGDYSVHDLVASGEVVSLTAAVSSGHAFSLSTIVESAGTLTVALAANAIVHSNNPKLAAIGKKVQSSFDKFRAKKSPLEDIQDSPDYKGPKQDNAPNGDHDGHAKSGGDWFHKMSKEKQKDYLDKHPNSVFHHDTPAHAATIQAKLRLNATETYAGRMTGVGAGVLFCARDTKRMLFVLRSPTCESPNTWCCLGGGVEPGETIEQGVRREVMEEGGFTEPFDLIPMHVDNQGDFTFHNHFAWVDEEFVPVLNNEHTDYKWSADLPTPMHPGLLRSILAYQESKRGNK